MWDFQFENQEDLRQTKCGGHLPTGAKQNEELKPIHHSKLLSGKKGQKGFTDDKNVPELQVYLILLHFALLHLLGFLQFEGLWQACVWSKTLGAIFSIASAHFMSLCHVLVILTIVQTFLLLLYLNSAIS